jgi:hypothetical protein
VWIVPASEEQRTRDALRLGEEVRVWKESEEPFGVAWQALKDRGAAGSVVQLHRNIALQTNRTGHVRFGRKIDRPTVRY